jgi:hypothetical protein
MKAERSETSNAKNDSDTFGEKEALQRVHGEKQS